MRNLKLIIYFSFFWKNKGAKVDMDLKHIENCFMEEPEDAIPI
jgi:hypothetical protein